jgi:anaerobic ribonucleoside-triphosphate reductase activating protein
MSDVDRRTVAVARFLPHTVAEGPGARTAIWVQGCSIRCRGCFNPHMWSMRGGELWSPEQLVARVVAAGTEGLTLLGGEPFDQAPALAVVATGVRAAGLSVMTFTGFTVNQLRGSVDEGRDDVAALLASTDLLVAGPFLADQIDTTRPWVGSRNQEFVALTNRYADIVDNLDNAHDRVEVNVDASGRVSVNGWAEMETLDALLADLEVDLTAEVPTRPRRGEVNHFTRR